MSKKTQAFWAIVQHSAGGSVVSALPTPGLETHKHLALSGNEITMCVRIAGIYSEMTMSKENVEQLLVEAGIAVGAGTGLAIVATKVGHGVVNELLNFIPIVGWAVKGALAGSLTVAVGCAFQKFCEVRFAH